MASSETWRDTRLSPAQRAEALLALMTLKEQLAQLVGAGRDCALRVARESVVLLRNDGGVLSLAPGRVPLEPGQAARATFTLPAVRLRLTGAEREVGHLRRLVPQIDLIPLEPGG